eukprot:8426646-Pyramimonas_sp.AAC.1
MSIPHAVKRLTLLAAALISLGVFGGPTRSSSLQPCSCACLSISLVGYPMGSGRLLAASGGAQCPSQ